MVKRQIIFQKNAFTLAEVLITLGVIGVVAALTMPNLIGNYQKKANVTALKKAFSVLNQAYIDINRIKGIDAVSMCTINDSKCLGDLFKDELRLISGTLWKPGSESADGCWEDSDITNKTESHYCTVTADGIVYDFDMEWQNTEDRINAYILIDTNGTKRPNKFGRDRYIFSIAKGTINPYKSNTLDDSIIPVCKDGKGTMTDNLGCAFKYLFNE